MTEHRQDGSGAVLLCGHVAGGAFPILRGHRDKPLFPEDSGWQFLCNIAPDEGVDGAKIWSIDEVLATDDSLRPILGEPLGTIVARTGPGSSWIITRFDVDADEQDPGQR